MRKTDIAYAAGFFDGEGTVVISLVKDKYLQLTIATSQKRPEVLWWMRKVFKGKVYVSTRYAAQWKMHGASAIAFLRIIRPFLIVKAVEVEFAERFWKIRKDPEAMKRLLVKWREYRDNN